MTDARSVSDKSRCSILNSLKFINMNCRKAIYKTVAVVRVDKGCGRLMRQILSDPMYVVEIIKRRAADVIDMANHANYYDVGNPSWNSDVGGKLNSFLECNNLAQLMAVPTRVTFNSLTTLDLVITNCPKRFRASGTLSPLSNCDHSIIFASMNLFTHRSRSYKRYVWNFDNVNITDLNEELSH